jgi:hypothetical protein
MTKIRKEAVDPEFEEKMAQKLEKDFQGNDWYGASLEAPRTPLIDPASGKPLVIRSFDFRMSPELKQLPSKQELFSAHAKQIMSLLWGDGLRPFEGASPRVAIDRKRRTYKIVVVAEPRLNTTVIETPQSLSTLLSTASKNGTPRH